MCSSSRPAASELPDVPGAPQPARGSPRVSPSACRSPGSRRTRIADYGAATANVVPSRAVVDAVHAATGGNSFFVTG